MFGPATKEGATRGQPVINKWRDPVPIKGADLYLINPSGIVFGQNATINVSGSFHASTADYLKNVGRRAVPGNQSQRQHIENSTTGGVWDSASSNESASALLTVYSTSWTTTAGGKADTYAEEAWIVLPNGTRADRRCLYGQQHRHLHPQRQQLRNKLSHCRHLVERRQHAG
jgi:hypothetical protein